MGDVVVRDGEKELRITHQDFQRYGKPDIFGNLKIPLSERWSTMTGDVQIALYHSADIDDEEKRFKGHNAYYGDMFGQTQMFAKNNENSRVHTMLLPDGRRLEIFHESGNPTIIEGVVKTQPEALEGPMPENEEKKPWNLFSRK